MSSDIWNPWHGCRKYSEGCDHCYMYYLDSERGKSGGEIYKVKTNFNLPLKKDRQGNYKIKSGESLRVCMTSDFFLEEADAWRDEVWDMIRLRPDVRFWLLTKRAHRIREYLPWDWLDGWENVSINVTAENQLRADERLSILLDIPAKHKGVMIAPFIGKVDLEPYLASGQLKTVFADGENYDGARPLHYEWVKLLYDQCRKYNVPFSFLEREMFLSRTEKSITSARLINTFRRCAPGCNILPLNRTAPFKHAAVPASVEIHVMDAGGAEGVEYPPITLWVIQ